MNPKLLSNIPLNAMKGLYGDVAKTAKGSVPLTYPIRNAQARGAYDKFSSAEKGAHKWGKGTLSPGRAAALAGSAYVAGDAGYRALSGGSMYRDKDGEKNFVGIPFI